MNDLIELRAALTQLAKALETERACVLRIMRVVERQIGAASMEEDMQDVTRAGIEASIAGARIFQTTPSITHT